MSESWSKDELYASVAAYLEMKQKVKAGDPVNKKAYYRELSKKFNRTEKAFEYRMQNISYVMSLMGREWIPGLKPARNVGTKIASEIEGLIALIEG